MTAHNHAEHVEGCFRCELSREESTPTTEEVRGVFASDEFGELKDRWAEEFDRWHQDEVRKAKAEAWRELAVRLAYFEGLDLNEYPNPYREEDDDDYL